MAKQLAFYFDASTCTGCRACQVACKDKNNSTVAVTWRRVREYGGGEWVPHSTDTQLMVPSNVFAYSISSSCMHCEQPICKEVCPTSAISKREDGVVLIDQNKCIGCRYCEWACPYGAPQFDEVKSVMSKCTFCADLLDKGENPACADACPQRALGFGELDELRSKYGNVNAIEPLPSADLTSPALVMTPHKQAQATGHGTGYIQSLEEG